jgi:hypothetical protein
MKKDGRGGEFMYDIFDTFKETINATICPTHHKKKGKSK